MIIKLTETMTIEMRAGHDGYSVDSVVLTNFGGYATNQIYWTKNEQEAIAFMNGVRTVNAIFNGPARTKTD